MLSRHLKAGYSKWELLGIVSGSIMLSRQLKLGIVSGSIMLSRQLKAGYSKWEYHAL